MLVLRTYLALPRAGAAPRPGGGDPSARARADAATAAAPATPPSPPAGARLDRVHEIRPEDYRALYSAVGRDFNWRDRLAWSDARLDAYLRDPAVAVWRLTVGDSDAGYFELRQGAVALPAVARAFTDADSDAAGHAMPAVAPRSDRPWELVYFGLVRGAQGRGLGRWLLERAIAEAWAGGADLLWLHTCSLDHPAAIPNYRARGFRPFATLLYEEDVPDQQPAPAPGAPAPGEPPPDAPLA